MCQSCRDIDKQIDQYQKSLRSTSDAEDVVRINFLIAQLYGDRVRLHRSPLEA
jgi:hypothetical protein